MQFLLNCNFVLLKRSHEQAYSQKLIFKEEKTHFL